MTNTYKNLEVQFNKLFRHLKVGSFKTRERYAKAFRRFMVFFAGRYNLGFSDFVARKKVSELLGHHRDDVTRIYLLDGE